MQDLITQKAVVNGADRFTPLPTSLMNVKARQASITVFKQHT